MRCCLLIGFALVLVSGCGTGTKYAPVSGRVTLNGQPLANATVSFQPIAPAGSIEAAPGSTGKTNQNGEYSLKGATGQNGAWVGTHRVRISLFVTDKDPEDDSRPPARGGPPIVDKMKKFNDTEQTFEVPSAGTDQANFDAKS